MKTMIQSTTGKVNPRAFSKGGCSLAGRDKAGNHDRLKEILQDRAQKRAWPQLEGTEEDLPRQRGRETLLTLYCTA